MLQRIAILLTSHNRKEKTVSCLKHLYEAYAQQKNKFEITIYLTDDGSTDGTAELVAKSFPQVVILKGSGSLYWAGGMRNSWKEALKLEYDGFLLLNDDTDVSKNLFNEIIRAHEYSIYNYKHGGIYVGSTRDIHLNKLSYGGAIITNTFFFKYEYLDPNNTIQSCDLGNANIMLVSKDAYNKIGMLGKEYIHGAADFAYTLTAKKYGVPILIMDNYCGICKKNDKNVNKQLLNLEFSERIKFLYNPIGLAFNDNLKLMKSFFPYRLPFVFIAGWFKVLFPKLYTTINNFR
jgi:GT2 family glycosyltransferase